MDLLFVWSPPVSGGLRATIEFVHSTSDGWDLSSPKIYTVFYERIIKILKEIWKLEWSITVSFYFTLPRIIQVPASPMFIHQSTQIIQIHVSNLMLRGYECYREIRWDDYVLHYMLKFKYIPTYLRMDWPSTTTHQTHTKGPKHSYITHTQTSNIFAFGGTGSTTRRVSFSG
jgi:hypothetical protein